MTYQLLGMFAKVIIRFCKIVNFGVHFIFSNSVKRHICHVKNSRVGHDLPKSINDKFISPFHKGFIFMKVSKGAKIRKRYNQVPHAKFRENKTLAKISEFTVTKVIIMQKANTGVV